MPVRERLPTWLLAAIVFAAGIMFVPFVPWMAMALWLGLYGRRVHEPLTRKLGGRVSLSAGITVSMLLLVVLPVAAVLTSIAIDTANFVQQLLESTQARAMLEKLVGGSPEAPRAASSSIVDLLLQQGNRTLQLVQSIAGVAARFVVGLLIMVTGMFGILVDGKRWYEWLERHTPLTVEHFRRFGQAFVETGRGLWYGIIGAGTLQALVATIAFIAIGVPSPLALGFLTLLFSIIPAIGTALVWVPVTVGLALNGRPAAAVSMAIVGIALISTVDNLARPWLAHRGKLQLPTWVVLIAMFGGVELIGGWGLVIGPLVVRLAKEALVISREARDPATSSPPVETTPTS